MLLDPGVSHRDSFAKYAAAFFTISRSSLALASSRRSRAFSASTSDTGRLTAAAALAVAPDPPSRLRRTQLVTVDCGMPSRLAAAFPPVDSANLTASVLNSSVYRRFGTASFFPIVSSVHQKAIKILMYVKPGQGHNRSALSRSAERFGLRAYAEK